MWQFVTQSNIHFFFNITKTRDDHIFPPFKKCHQMAPGGYALGLCSIIYRNKSPIPKNRYKFQKSDFTKKGKKNRNAQASIDETVLLKNVFIHSETG